MPYRLPLRLALFTLLTISAFAPFATAQPQENPTPDPSYQATPTPEPTVTPVPTEAPTPTAVPEPSVTPEPTYDPYAPDLVPPVDPDATPEPTPEPTPTSDAPDDASADAASSINVAIGVKGATTANNLIPKNVRKTCFIRLTSPLKGGATSATVWLTTLDDRVRFVGGNASNQLSLVLPGNLDTVSFEVEGKIGSKAPNDAVINAHRNAPTTGVCGTLKMTVWWTSYAEMSVTQGDRYDIDTPSSIAYFHPITSNVAVRLRGQYVLNPSGADFSGFGFGVMQNFRSSGYSIVLSNPTVKWGTAIKGQTLPSVETTIRNTSSVPNVVNDCLPGAWPLYAPSQAATAGINVVYTSDGPGTKAGRPSIKEFRDTAGNLLATVKWTVDASINCDARDWVVTYIKSEGKIYPAAESNWALDVVYPNTSVQKAQNGSSHAVQNRRVTGTATTVANDVLKQNQNFSVVGTTVFIKP